ncbi:hypothetical protein [Myroides profundi]|uniref:Uncharacterized protein n=1 Tax=Myroides profundi TaxID=480520 RepID=A0AAJ4W2Z0_MYRPR|nr:hypothetical protein [Myroides profundi]AJH16423.1 hypothetical protein MPR_3303 [Myroides profundi]SEQ55677.1 hypothetical protein SAMN04488089_10452 [Myroides profundi]
MINTILTGFISAVLALYLKYYYDKDKEEKELELVRLSLLDIFIVNISPALKVLSFVYKDAATNFNDKNVTNIISHNFIHFLDIDFQNYLDKNKVIAILGKRKIKSSLLYNINKNLLYLKNQNAKTIMANFQKEENIIIDNYNNKISQLNLLVSNTKSSEIKFQLDKKKLEINNLRIKTKFELDSSYDILNVTIEMVDEIILHLK